MDCKGTLKDVTKDWMTGRFRLTFEVDKDVSGEIERLSGKLLALTAKVYRRKRSLDANSYYWSLLTKLAEVIGVSKNRAHNVMLRRYGKLEVIDGSMIYVVVPDNDEGERMALEAETYHIKPTSEVKETQSGLRFRTYVMLRGSSTYDTAEMSTLINGLVEECKDLGIETMTPQELERMMALYEQNRRKRVHDG
ncbi:hypothetical protein [Enterocloster lavalensis]|uniref:Uncharacterized protein n=1 Tax=Enterocloster lavalensis TaxID=460384 RepID=A0A1I0JZD4_9FIRM|nr:hypothetical protein [Enterocloster lavalensis]SEU15838.1 hypothetical protein SAMN05216313_13849 [Enterocloster lavalensis]